MFGSDCWVFVAWIRNLQVPKEDQHGEYPAVILIDTPTAEQAQGWGDQMYREVLEPDDTVSFMWSEVHRPDDPRYRLGDKPLAEYWADTPRCAIGERLSVHVLL